MKKQQITIIFILLYQFIFSQDTSVLDSKAGFKDIKIGKPISELIDKVKKDEKVNILYLIKDISKYEIENHKIYKIIITVSEDDKEIIEHITFMFVDRVNDLIRIAKDRNENLETRKKALAEAERLSKEENDYSFYVRLFKDAFGEPKKEKGVKSWVGKKIQLICTKVRGVGFCDFSKVLTEEEESQVKKARGQKASSKF